MQTIFSSQSAAGASNEVAVDAERYAQTVLVQVEGLTVDSATPQGTLDGTNWYTLQGTDLSSGSSSTSITADGIYRFDVSGLAAFRLTKVGATDSISAYARTVIG